MRQYVSMGQLHWGIRITTAAVTAAVMAAGYGTYALLGLSFEPATASALTAVAAAILCAVLVAVLLRLGKVAPKPQAQRRPEPAGGLPAALTGGAAFAAALADVALQYRRGRQTDPKPSKRKRRCGIIASVRLQP